MKVLNIIEGEKKALQASIRNQTSFDKRKLYLIDGAYHVLFAIGQICDSRIIDRLEFNSVKEVVPDDIRYVSELVEIEQSNDATFSFNRFFKDAKTKTQVATYIQSSELDKNHI